MINRISQYLNPENPSTERRTDCWWIETRENAYFVSVRTARSVERRLEREPMPRWIVFRDLTGARHRILAADVRCISESTAAQRKSLREFRRALNDEQDDDQKPSADVG